MSKSMSSTIFNEIQQKDSVSDKNMSIIKVTNNIDQNLESVNDMPVNFLKKKRKESDDKEFANSCGKLDKEDKKNFNDEKKITDFFKQKKKLNYDKSKFSPSKNLSDEELSSYSNSDSERITNSKNLINDINYKFINEEITLPPPANFNVDKNTGFTLAKLFNSSVSNNLPKKKDSPISNKKKKVQLNRLDKNIKEYFKEYRLSSKTLETLKKGKFINDNERRNSITTKGNLTINVNNLPVSSSLYSKSDKHIKDIENILKSLSMKEKYEGLLKRELILPPPYKLLFLQFSFLDQTLLDLKFSKNGKTNLEKIQEECKKKDFKIGLFVEDFQKMLFIAPIFYLYKFEMIKLTLEQKNRLDMTVDIPEDLEKRMKNNYSSTTILEFQNLQSLEINRAIQSRPSEESMNMRSKFFKDILLNMTKVQHDRFIKKKNIKFDAVKAGTWHSEFDLDEVNKIKMFNLISKPTKEKKAYRV